MSPLQKLRESVKAAQSAAFLPPAARSFAADALAAIEAESDRLNRLEHAVAALRLEQAKGAAHA